MGFRGSWIAVQGQDKDAVLAKLRLVDTGRPTDGGIPPFAGATLSSGWYLVETNDVDYPPADLLAELSSDAVVLCCQVEEHVMFAGLRCFERGAETWAVEHDPGKTRFDLKVRGEPPAAFAGIRDSLTAEQEAEGGEDAEVDLIFDIPITLGGALCNFRHDGGEEVEDPAFTRLTSLDDTRAARPSGGSGGLLAAVARLFGRG